MRTVLRLATAAAAWCAAAPAAAAAPPKLIDGPVVAGDTAVVVTREHRRVRVQRLEPDGTLHPLTQFDPLLGGRDTYAAVKASGDRLLVAVGHSPCFPTPHGPVCVTSRTSVYFARLDGPAHLLSDCNPALDALGANDLAIAGDRAAYLACRGLDEPRAIEVRDLSGPDGTALRIPVPDGYDAGEAIRMAGEYLAVHAYGYIGGDVRDVVEMYSSATGEQLLRYDHRTAGFDIQADGKLVLARLDGHAKPPARCSPLAPLAWLSPTEPQLHELPVTPCQSELALDSDRLVYQPRSGLAAVPLSGGPSTVVAPPQATERFDADGGLIAFRETLCAGEQVAVADLTGGPFDSPERCIIRLVPPRPVRQRRGDGVIAVRALCPRGCSGMFSGRLVGHPGHGASVNFKLAAGVARVIELPLHVPRRLAGSRARIVMSVEQPVGAELKVRRTLRVRATEAR